MSIRVLYFAILREERGCAEEVVEIDEALTLASLFKHIFNRPALGIRFAQNQIYVSGETVISDDDEIAFLPPLGGG